MERSLAGSAAVVTGAGRGIGRAVALSLAGEGARVVLAARTRPDLEAVCAEIARLEDAPEALAVPTDVADEPSVAALVAAVRERFGRLDILVNNAGAALSAPIAETTAADWDRLMAVNARGPFLLCREALPLMIETVRRSRAEAAKRGEPPPYAFIVNIASVVGVKGYVNQGAYTASKHALMGLTKVLAREVKDAHVRVHALCPGGVATPMVRTMRPDLDPAVLMAPEEIADIVLFLVTRRGNAVMDDIHVRRQAGDPWF